MLGQAAGFALLAAVSPTALLVMAVFLGSDNPRTTALMYAALHNLRRKPTVPVGFIHLPYEARQAGRHRSLPSMPLTQMENAVRIAIIETARTAIAGIIAPCLCLELTRLAADAFGRADCAPLEPRYHLLDWPAWRRLHDDKVDHHDREQGRND